MSEHIYFNIECFLIQKCYFLFRKIRLSLCIILYTISINTNDKYNLKQLKIKNQNIFTQCNTFIKLYIFCLMSSKWLYLLLFYDLNR